MCWLPEDYVIINVVPTVKCVSYRMNFSVNRSTFGNIYSWMIHPMRTDTKTGFKSISIYTPVYVIHVHKIMEAMMFRMFAFSFLIIMQQLSLPLHSKQLMLTWQAITTSRLYGLRR